MWKSIIAIVIIGAAAKVSATYYEKHRTESQIKASIERVNQQLPMVYKNAVRLEKLEYQNNVVRASVFVFATVDVNDSMKAGIESSMKDTYCNGNVKPLKDAKVGVEYSIKFESVFYKNIEWLFKYAPENCV